MVEPEDAIDAAGAIVDNELEEFFWFEVAEGDDAEDLGAREAEGSMAREGDWV